MGILDGVSRAVNGVYNSLPSVNSVKGASITAMGFAYGMVVKATEYAREESNVTLPNTSLPYDPPTSTPPPFNESAISAGAVLGAVALAVSGIGCILCIAIRRHQAEQDLGLPWTHQPNWSLQEPMLGANQAIQYQDDKPAVLEVNV